MCLQCAALQVSAVFRNGKQSAHCSHTAYIYTAFTNPKKRTTIRTSLERKRASSREISTVRKAVSSFAHSKNGKEREKGRKRRKVSAREQSLLCI